MEKLEIILTFSFIVSFYTIGSQNMIQGPIEGPKIHSGGSRGPSYSNYIYLC